MNADVPAMEVLFVSGPNPLNPIGTKGVGEIGIIILPVGGLARCPIGLIE